MSDECVDASYRGIYERAKARKMPPIDQFGPAGVLELQKLSSEIKAILCVVICSIQHYDLATALFGNTLHEHCYPMTVIEYLANIESSRIESNRIKFVAENLHCEKYSEKYSENML
jgi:hypothetical protein